MLCFYTAAGIEGLFAKSVSGCTGDQRSLSKPGAAVLEKEGTTRSIQVKRATATMTPPRIKKYALAHAFLSSGARKSWMVPL